MFWNDEDLVELEGTQVVGLFNQSIILVVHIVDAFLHV